MQPLGNTPRSAAISSHSQPILIGTWLTIGALFATVYMRVISQLTWDWWRFPDFSYGFLVPAFSAYLVWLKRRQLIALPHAPSWCGPAIVAIGLIAFLLGTFSAELFLCRVSIVLVLAGSALTYGGSRMLAQLRMPLAVLLLAIPIPVIVFNQLTFPLQLFSSRLASELLSVIGVPVLREGNVLVLPEMRLEVAEACSGIRSLMTLLTLSIFYGYLFDRSRLRRLLLVLSCVPIAIAGNVVRLLGTGICIRYWNPDKAVGFFHEFSGWVIYLISFAGMLVFHQVLRFATPKGAQR